MMEMTSQKNVDIHRVSPINEENIEILLLLHITPASVL